VCDRHGRAETQARDGDGHRPGYGTKKNLLERAYQLGEQFGLATWTEDEAGPYQTLPYPGESWQPEGHPAQFPHEYIRNGTAKILTLFHPASGAVRVKGVQQSTNAILHPWLQEQLTEILATLPAKARGGLGRQPAALAGLASGPIFADPLTRTATTVADVADLG